MIRVSASGLRFQTPPSRCTNGYQYIRKPSRKIRAVRRRTFSANCPCVAGLLKLKAMAQPTANRKDGKTQSAPVKPNHLAWTSQGKGCAPGPGVLTTIIRATARPRKTSRDRKRSAGLAMGPSLGAIQRGEKRPD